LAGEATASVLFAGRDGALYKSGYAPLYDDAGRVVGAVGVDGAAAIYEQLAGFRRTLVVAGSAGALLVGLLSIVVARRITRPPGALVGAARGIGEGDLSRAIRAPTGRLGGDEIGFLAETLEAMRLGLH